MDQLYSQLSALGITQVIALITGVIYVVLAARERSICWIFGIVSCAMIAWDDFTTFNLYADGVLQLLYVVLGFVGLYQWQFGRTTSSLKIHQLPLKEHGIAALLLVVLSIPVGWLLRTYTDAAFSYLDTLTTLFSIYATWLLVRKVLGNWLYWIVIDAIYVYLFFSRGGALISVLYFIYLVVAVYGFVHWRQRMQNERVVETQSK